MFEFIIMGLVLGGSAGLAPGPLLALVISETVEQDVAAGIKVALAPLISDLPIVIASVALLTSLSRFESVLGGVSLVGGAVVFRMGVNRLKTASVTIRNESGARKTLFKGILVNVLSPHPYLFWISVGGPMVHRAREDHSVAAAAFFIAAFYILLVGSKVCLALLTARWRSVLTGRGYVYTMRTLGIVLCLLSLILFKDGLALLNVF